MFVGPAQRVATGRYAQTIDHLNVLATVLQQYGAPDAFRGDFRAAFDTPEAARAHANLQPLTLVFFPAWKSTICAASGRRRQAGSDRQARPVFVCDNAP
ncbi:hypothetical protein [Immundisolibacter sp.]